MTVPALNAAREKIEEARRIQANEQQAAFVAYKELVSDSLVGKEVDPDEVLATLAAAGIEFDEFEGHIRREETRAALKLTADDFPVVNDALNAMRARQATISAEVDEFNKRIEQENRKFIIEESDLRRRSQEALRAKDQLDRLPAFCARVK